jgi:AcrR family transcriptional regulator
VAILVDKDRKREQIALSCKDLIISSNINSLTISAITKEAGIGKGTFYEYFKDKDELVFTLVTILMQIYNEKTEAKLKAVKSTKEKLKLFAAFYYNKEDSDLRAIYNQFLAISILSPDNSMKEFQTECNLKYKDWLKDILQEGVKNQELPPQVIEQADGLFIAIKGLYVTYLTTNSIPNLQEAIDGYLESMYSLMRGLK